MVDGDALKHPLLAFTHHGHAAVGGCHVHIIGALVDDFAVLDDVAQIIWVHIRAVTQRIAWIEPVISYPLDDVKVRAIMIEGVAVDLLSAHIHLVNAQIVEVVSFEGIDVLVVSFRLIELIQDDFLS